MIVYFADGPLNGQTRDIEWTWRYRVPLMDSTKIGYWEGSNGLSEVDSFPPVRVGYYEPIDAYLKGGAQIWVYQGIEPR